jgi:hypothetical protein
MTELVICGFGSAEMLLNKTPDKYTAMVSIFMTGFVDNYPKGYENEFVLKWLIWK